MVMKKIAVCGTPDFCLPFFNKILSNKEIKIHFAITQPPKKSKRGQKMTRSPVAEWAFQNKIASYEIDKIKNFEKNEELEAKLAEIDTILLFAFGKIIPKKWLDLPKYGWLNIHPSRLPEWRGPAPIQYTLLNRQKSSALTLMLMDEKMDEGPIIAQRAFKINENHNKNTIMRELCFWGPAWVEENLLNFLQIPKTQKQSGTATYSSLIKKEDLTISSNNSIKECISKIKSFGYIKFDHPKFGPLKCFLAEENSEKRSEIEIELKDGFLKPIYLQKPNKKIMHYKVFLRGNKI